MINPMNMKNQKDKKRTYSPPFVKRVKLDNEISLILESPPKGPDESYNNAPSHFNNDPFKTNHG
jgi:hypothetical protein